MSGWVWFWFVLTMAAVAWYTLVTIYVAVRGGFDIRGMLSRLKQETAGNPDGTMEHDE